MKNVLVVMAVILAQVVSSSAFAKGGDGGVQFGLSVGKGDTKVETSSSSSESKSTFLDLNLNYSFGGLYVGGQYGSRSGDDTGSQMGPTIGYRNNGFFVQGSYFLSADYKSSSTEYKKGTGIGIDFGYNAMVSNSFYIGTQLSQRSVTYKEYTSSGTTTEADTKITILQPMINLGFMF